MARVIFTAVVDEIRGSIGGTTFQKNAFGFTIKAKSAIVNPRTLRQTAKKILFQRAVQSWATLTAGERSNWTSYASNFPVASRNNPNSFLSGFQLFVRWHALRFEVTNTILADPSGDQGTVSLSSSSVVNTAGVITVEWEAAITEGPWTVFAYVSRPLKSTINFVEGLTRFVGTEIGVNGDDTIIITDEYEEIFGVLPAVGNRVGLDLTFVNQTNGQIIFIPTQIVVVT